MTTRKMDGDTLYTFDDGYKVSVYAPATPETDPDVEPENVGKCYVWECNGDEAWLTPSEVEEYLQRMSDEHDEEDTSCYRHPLHNRRWQALQWRLSHAV